MTKLLHIEATVPVPDDVFDQNDILGKISPAKVALHEALKEIGGDQVTFVTRIVRPGARGTRKPAAAAVADVADAPAAAEEPATAEQPAEALPDVPPSHGRSRRAA